jgi:hypothetical protein
MTAACACVVAIADLTPIASISLFAAIDLADGNGATRRVATLDANLWITSGY